MPDLNQLANDYDEAAREADAVIAQRLIPLLGQLRAYASRIAHKQTGRLARGLRATGPVRRVGVVAGAIVASVAYADNEVQKGGEHDYAGRTLAENAAAIQEWTDDTGVAIVRKVGGVS